MTQRDEIRQLLTDLESANDPNAERRIRHELRKRGHYVSKHGKLIAGVVMTRREGPPRPIVTTMRLESEIHRRLQLLAADEGRSANAIVEELVRKHLDDQGVPARLERNR